METLLTASHDYQRFVDGTETLSRIPLAFGAPQSNKMAPTDTLYPVIKSATVSPSPQQPIGSASFLEWQAPTTANL
ncbi:unnamed protein product [Caenorhabditis brenneri]